MLMTHVLAELYGCDSVIEDGTALADAAKSAARSVGATIVGEIGIRYVPHGVTVAVFLAESHIVVSTWPEYHLTLIDILMCNPEMDHGAVVTRIHEQICPDGQIVVHEVGRRIAAHP